MSYPANAAYPVASTGVRGLTYPKPFTYLFGYHDSSYGNDVTDSVMFACPAPDGRLVGYRLWIDYADPAERETCFDKPPARFSLWQCSADAMAHVLLAPTAGTIDSIPCLIGECEDTAVRVCEDEDPEVVLAWLKATHPSITIYSGV
jgi:hypothetical protein